jgi:hypothetical protein
MEGDSYEKISWQGPYEDKPSKIELETKAREILAQMPYNRLRAERDLRMRAVDWVTLKSIRTGQPMSQAWKDYMQALADITEQTPVIGPDRILQINWPTRPDGKHPLDGVRRDRRQG